MLKTNLKELITEFEKEEIQVLPFEEFRINTFFARKIFLKLIEGSAEIFGCEMTYNYYLIPSDLKSISVFSPQGCRLEIFFQDEEKKQMCKTNGIILVCVPYWYNTFLFIFLDILFIGSVDAKDRSCR